MPGTTPLDDQYAHAVDRERTRIEDEAVRTTRAILLAAMLELTGSILGLDDSDPIDVVAARAGVRLESGLNHGLLKSYLTGRQRSMVTAAVIEQHSVVSSPSLSAPVIPAPRLITPSGVERAIASAKGEAAGFQVGTGLFNRGSGVGGLQRPRRAFGSPSGGGGSATATAPRGGGGGGSNIPTTPKLPTSPGGGRPRPMSVNEIAKRFHDARLNLSDAQVRKLSAKYGQAAKNISGQIGSELHKAALKIAGELIDNPLSTDDAAAFIKSRLGKLGLSPAKPYAVETVYRSSVQMAYAAGRWEADQDPAVLNMLWGYVYVAVMDDRTTTLCSTLDGMSRPVDDPVWLTRQPPNHWGCRSVIRGIFKGSKDAVSTTIPDVVIPADFAVNWGMVLRDIGL